MENLIKKLDVLPGSKTYLIVLVAIVLNVLVDQGAVDVSSLELINTCLAALGLGTVRLAVGR